MDYNMKDLNPMDLSLCVRRLPKSLKDIMIKYGDQIIVAGGYIRSVLTGEYISDVDVFAGDKIRSLGFATMLSPKSSPHQTDNAITIRNLSLSVQFIHRWVYDNPSDVLKSFDFSICQAAIWFNSESEKWVGICTDRYYMDLACKRLHYCNPIRNEDAGGSMLRVLKYYQRGYRIPLDSLGAVISRLCNGFRFDDGDFKDEEWRAKIITGLLFEVDPNGIVAHEAYFPRETEEEKESG